jgi:hypothetical protein
MVDKSARCPRIRESAFRSIDFPEPVSPVSIQRPEAKETSKSSMSAKFLIDREANTVYVYRFIQI